MQARGRRTRSVRAAAVAAVPDESGVQPPAEPADDTLRAARELVRQLESGRQEEASRVLGELTRIQEMAVYQEMGRLTRQLHDALARLELDDHLVDLTAQEIPEAKERLAYVVTLTEQAANQTLSAVEESLPITVGLKEQAAGLAATWDRFLRRDLEPSELRPLGHAVGAFLSRVAHDSDRVHGKLSEVLMAQGFQDLTGQVLRRVTGLVQEVENSLVNIIRDSGPRVSIAARASQPVSSEATGASIGRAGQGDVVASQDEVDALLSSLGF